MNLSDRARKVILARNTHIENLQECTPRDAIGLARSARFDVLDEMKSVVGAAEEANRDLTSAEARKFSKLESDSIVLTAAIEQLEGQRGTMPAGILPGSTTPVGVEGNSR